MTIVNLVMLISGISLGLSIANIISIIATLRSMHAHKNGR